MPPVPLPIYIPLIIALLLMLIAALMAAIDSSINSLRRSELLDLGAGHPRAAKSITAIADDPMAHSNAINFVRVFSETTMAVLIALSSAYSFENVWVAFALAAGLVTISTFFLVGVSPRSIASQHPDKVLVFTAGFTHFIRVVLGPIANGLVALGNRITPGRGKNVGFRDEDQLLTLVDEAAEAELLDDDDRELIHSVFEFGDAVVREVMVPRTDMITVSDDAALGQALDLFIDRAISRVPVIGEDADEVVGVLYLRDVVKFSRRHPENWEATAVTDVMKPAVFIPEQKKADDTLKQMQQDFIHLALVIDEYGGVSGLVTLEDLIEELVGEIADEHDKENTQVVQLGKNSFQVSARLPIDELAELFGMEFEIDDVDTVAGLFSMALGHLPEAGSKAEYRGLVFTATKVEGRPKQLTLVRVDRSADLPEEVIDEFAERS